MNTLFTGQQIIRLTEVDSTNNYTNRLLRQSVMPEGTVVVAEKQTSGKGQRGNSWVSEPGQNLTCSIFFRPDFLKAHQQFYLTKAVSLGIIYMLEHLGVENCKIKWPNDILIGGKKVCGILIENSLKGTCIQHSIVGVGLNVNQEAFSELPNATSLFLATGKKQNIDTCLALLCKYIESQYLRLKNNHFSLDQEYLGKLWQLGEWADYRGKAGNFRGCILGVNEEGKLLIELEKKEKKLYSFQEIQFVLN